MGRAAQRKNGVSGHPLLFDAADLPKISRPAEKDFQSLVYPVWSEDKARLIQEYIRLFTYITKHGAYIDGFAAPQQRRHEDICSAKLVLEVEPKRVRDFWLCDLDPRGVAQLRKFAEANQTKGRRIDVVQGDFNATVDQILASGRIREKTASFALLDQRMFECEWATVEKLARHKAEMKIELFYFFATGWIDRSIAAVKRNAKAEALTRWWGRDDWKSLRRVQSVPRAIAFAERFRTELGYTWAYPYAIHDRKKGGRIMYHMIHATDHPEASPLMQRAYRKVSGRSSEEELLQTDLQTLWQELKAGVSAQ